MLRKLMILTLVLALTIGFMPSVVAQDGAMDAPPGYDSWEDVLAEAEGQTVNFNLWGGSDAINEFVDIFYGDVLEEEFGITLNRVPLADTVDAVNQVLSEAEAGVEGDEGSIDLIWINGENFFTLRQADLLYGPFAENLPNNVFVNNEGVGLDFGRPTEGYESVWSGAQLHFLWDTARMSEEDLPRSYAELTAWIEANPGRFTYVAPGPGAFQGTRFVKQIFFELSGSRDQWDGEFNQELYDEWAPQVWDLLNSWEPNLWREGETYPADSTELLELFANGEVDFALTQAPSGAARDISAGLVPETASAFTFDANSIGDFNYVAIPFNAPNKAAALVLANLMLRPDRQAAQVVPENGFGLGLGIDTSRVTDEADREAIAAALETFGDAAADSDRLGAALVADLVAEYQSLIETDWEANVLQN
jgi:putative spermidine/putrescine transport system substrate-binding protein